MVDPIDNELAFIAFYLIVWTDLFHVHQPRRIIQKVQHSATDNERERKQDGLHPSSVFISKC
jgi:hypothetical protein